MAKHTKSFLVLLCIFSACKNNDAEIVRLLNSKRTIDIIEGTYQAGTSGDRKYVPLLLKDVANPHACTALRWKGFTVYAEKMHALEKILHVKPPHDYHGVLRSPDSVNIKFYNNLWRKMNKIN